MSETAQFFDRLPTMIETSGFQHSHLDVHVVNDLVGSATPFGAEAVPTTNTIKKEMEFLSAVESAEIVSQQTLSRRIGVSVGLVNALLKRAMRKGYVKASSAPAKRWAYYLTPNGACEKGRLVAEYIESSLDLFRHARGELEAIFARAKLRGQTRIVLAGCGDLAEIAVLAAHDSGIVLIGLLAPHSNLASQQGLKIIQGIDEAGEFDLVVITEMRTPQQTFDSLKLHIRSDLIVAPALLRISTVHRTAPHHGGAAST